jgi:hypothetical protein
VHAPAEDKSNDIKDGFYKEPEHVFVLKKHMKILLGDFSAIEGREDIFKPTIGNGNHEISDDNGARVVNFAISENVTVKRMMFPHHNIDKYFWNSSDQKTHDQSD